MKKTLKRYILSGTVGNCASSAICLALSAACIADTYLNDGELLLIAVVFAAPAVIALLPLRSYVRFFRALKASGEKAALEADFQNAAPMLNDRIRFGENWIFPKGKPLTVPYDKIRKVYQEVRERGSYEVGRKLMCTNRAGDAFALCDLKTNGVSNADVVQMVKIIKSKNPNVTVGFLDK